LAQALSDRVIVNVIDQGPGFPPGREEAMFEKFIRGSRESAQPGVGLGLAICRAIVRAHNGEISASNRADGGAQVSFSLPLGGADAPAAVFAESHDD
jgi:two-component system sensor histidine kinase KdpD